MKKFKLLIYLACTLSAVTEINAQSTVKKNLTAAERLKNSEVELDTEESIKYVGNEILFQLKKRLHLSSETEEKKENSKKKKVALSFFGIKIEKEEGEY